MTVTAIDPSTALVLIDLQKGIVSLPVAHSSAEVVQKAVDIAEAFRRRGRPVVLVNVAGRAPGRTEAAPNLGQLPADWSDLVPELNAQPEDHLITKHTWGAFTGTHLEAYLRSRDVTQVVVAGISTSIGVETTARQAYERGFNVTLATDAMTDMKAEAHENSVTRIFPRLGETGTAQDVIAMLDQT